MTHEGDRAGFLEVLERTPLDGVRAAIAAATAKDVERALAKGVPDESDLPALFSPAAVPYLEELAKRSAAVTLRRFGRVIQLYTPLYLSNECVNRCTYCGFSHDNAALPRLTLDVPQVVEEGAFLANERFRHILLVAGESRRWVPLEYVLECVRALSPLFESIAIELQPFRRAEYEQLAAAGVDGLALYQETYDPAVYDRIHVAGPKKNFARRLLRIEEAGEAGLRSLGVAALLGLADWRVEAVRLAQHGRYLARRFWRSKLAVSFPRIRHAAGDFVPPFAVSDRDLVQMICAMRLVLPDAELVLSTREPAFLRDNLVGLGITRMSAGSRTQPGGYAHFNESGEQFEVVDPRTVEQVAAMIVARGYEPVFKDFDRAFREA